MAFIVSSLLVLSYENFREFLDKMCRCDGMVDVADSKSAGGDSVWVRVPPPAPRRGKVRFAPTFFISIETKNVIRPLPCSSVSNRTRCCWASVWGRRFAAVLPFYTEISLLTVPSVLRS